MSLLDYGNPKKRQPIELYVAFCNSKEKHWWNLFTRDGYEHVCVYGQAGDDVVILDPIMGGLHVEIQHNVSASSYAFELVKTGLYKVLRVQNTPASKYTARGTFSCVSFAKYSLGLVDYRTVTPYQLWKLLKGREGVLDYNEIESDLR